MPRNAYREALDEALSAIRKLAKVYKNTADVGSLNDTRIRAAYILLDDVIPGLDEEVSDLRVQNQVLTDHTSKLEAKLRSKLAVAKDAAEKLLAELAD